MRTAAGKTGFLRSYDYKRHKLTMGYTAFYSLGIAVVSILVSKLLSGALSLFPAFLGYGPFGALYVFDLLFYVVLTLFLLIFPGMLIFDGIPTNQWNMYYKDGIGINKLLFNKILFCFGSILRVFAIGLVPVAAVGFLAQNGQSAAGVAELLMAVLLGVFITVAMLAPAVFAGSLIHNRFFVRVIVLITACGVGFLLYRSGFFAFAEEAEAVASVRALVVPSPLSLSVIALICVVLFVAGVFLFAGNRVRNYDTEELDDDDLIALGITRNIMVYERDGDALSVAISGPEVHGVDEEPDIPDLPNSGEPDDEDEPRGKKSRKKKKRRGEDEDE